MPTLISIRIKDGLYIGNSLSSRNLQFLLANKFTYIINCTSQLKNHFLNHPSFQYLRLKYSANPNKPLSSSLFGSSYRKLNKIIEFISECEEKGECCLVHSKEGNNRVFVVVVAYLMWRYRWGYQKVMEYVEAKVEREGEVKMAQKYVDGLKELEMQMGELSKGWELIGNESDEEVVLVKTYINTVRKHEQKREPKQYQKFEKYSAKSRQKENIKTVQWKDLLQKRNKKLFSNISQAQILLTTKQHNPTSTHKFKQSQQQNNTFKFVKRNKSRTKNKSQTQQHLIRNKNRSKSHKNIKSLHNLQNKKEKTVFIQLSDEQTITLKPFESIENNLPVQYLSSPQQNRLKINNYMNFNSIVNDNSKNITNRNAYLHNSPIAIQSPFSSKKNFLKRNGSKEKRFLKNKQSLEISNQYLKSVSNSDEENVKEQFIMMPNRFNNLRRERTEKGEMEISLRSSNRKGRGKGMIGGFAEKGNGKQNRSEIYIRVPK